MIAVVLSFWVVFAYVGGWLARQKRRSFLEGFLLGFLLGPLGVLVAGLAPTLPPPPPPVRGKGWRSRRREWSAR